MSSISSNTTIESINARIENLRTTRQFCGDATVRATITRRMSTLENERRTVLSAIVAKHSQRVAAPVKVVAPVPAPKVSVPVAPTKVEHSTDRDDVMALKDATLGQMKRINRKYAAQGMRTFESINAFRTVFPTMLDASLEYRNLA